VGQAAGFERLQGVPCAMRFNTQALKGELQRIRHKPRRPPDLCRHLTRSEHGGRAAHRAEGRLSGIPVLIEGESASARSCSPAPSNGSSERIGPSRFVAVNRRRIPETPKKSRGIDPVSVTRRAPSTGAKPNVTWAIRPKLSGGTLFSFDEVASCRWPHKVKLLRALQEGTSKPSAAASDRRSTSASIPRPNRKLLDLVNEAVRSAEDLFYRMHVLPADVAVAVAARRHPQISFALLPGAVQRPEENRNQINPDQPSEANGASFPELDGPGNIRQTRKPVYRAVVLKRERYALGLHDFPQAAAPAAPGRPLRPAQRNRWWSGPLDGARDGLR